MRPLAVLALLVLALAACGGSDRAADESPETTSAATTTAATPSGDADLFAFDRDGPLGVTEGETAQQPEFTAKAMSYASPGGDRVPGIVLLPKATASPRKSTRRSSRRRAPSRSRSTRRSPARSRSRSGRARSLPTRRTT